MLAMDIGLIVLAVIVVLATFVIGLLWLKKQIQQINGENKSSEVLLEWLKSSQTNIDQRLHQNTEAINSRLDNTAQVIAEVKRNIGEMSEIGRSVKQLQNFLSSPKLRGNIGEQVLKELLGQALPKNSFNLQYTFKSGATVDAAIKTSAGIIAIDSKFPMENFGKASETEDKQQKQFHQKAFLTDVRKHIKDIAQKYILTEEGTLDYALMYVPSEAIYYEIINTDPGILDFAHQNRVLPVSPSTFYAYLRAILMSFEGQKIESRAREILKTIKALEQDYHKIDSYLAVLNKHLTNAFNQMNNVSSAFTRLGQKISNTSSLPEPKEKED